ncbi:hypothetical protein [Sideroxyarcus emersonii]|nr:hypothetical protein [Sideroxyarcus emersonii]
MNPNKVYGDLINSASGAKTHYEVWWAQASRARPEYVGVMNRHSDFFRASYHAHYTSFFVCLAHLFDRRTDSSSIPTFFTAVRPTIAPTTLQALEARFEVLAKRARPLVEVRHKTVAHIDAKLTEKDVFAPLSITWNEIREIIYDTCRFVEELNPTQMTPDVGQIGIPRDERLIEATMKLIRELADTQKR